MIPEYSFHYMDRHLSPSVDILRVTVSMDNETHMKFQVMLRGTPKISEQQNYLVFKLAQSKKHELLIPLISTDKAPILMFDLDTEEQPLKEFVGYSDGLGYSEIGKDSKFYVNKVDRGIEISIPLSWVNFNSDFSYDAFTVNGRFDNSRFIIDKLYDQAAKGGRKREKRFSAIKLLNTLCITRK